MRKMGGLLLPLALIMALAQVLLILSSWQLLPPLVPLYYSKPWGEEQLSQPIGLFLLPVSTITVIAGNSLLGRLLFSDKNLARTIMAAGSAIFSFLALIGLVQIIRLVI